MPRNLSHFQDRHTAIRSFDSLWLDDTPWILSFHGVSGQGKSTLLDWLEVNRCIPNSMRYAYLSIGDHISDEATFLARIIETNSSQFSNSDIARFLQVRMRIMNELNQRKIQISQSQTSENSPESRQSMSANLAEAIREMDKQALKEVIEHWLVCMRTVPSRDQFILLLDNYDVNQDRASLDEIRVIWNTLERARQILPNFRVILASREEIRHVEFIESLKRGLGKEGLADLSSEDSRALL